MGVLNTRFPVRERKVAVVGEVSNRSKHLLEGLTIAFETQRLDNYYQEKFLKSLLPIKPKETGLVTMSSLLAKALQDPDNTAIVIEDEPPAESIDEASTVELVTALESCGVKVFTSMAEAVVWVNKTV